MNFCYKSARIWQIVGYIIVIVKILGRPLNFFRFPVANFAFLNFGKPHNPVFLYFIFLCALNKNFAGTGARFAAQPAGRTERMTDPWTIWTKRSSAC